MLIWCQVITEVYKQKVLFCDVNVNIICAVLIYYLIIL